MKLYYSPGACSLSPHIVLCELGLPHQLVRVDLKTHTVDGTDFYQINPKGYVPALQLDDGQLLTEGPAITQYLADQKPEAGLLPPAGTLARARVQEWLTYIGTELHKSFVPLFRADSTDEAKQAARAYLAKRLDLVEATLARHAYLTGERFSIADAYLFVVLNWTAFTGIDLAPWPAIGAFRQRVAERPAVRQAMQAEGLLR